MSSPRPGPTAPGADPADTLPVPRPGTLFARALRLRCLACGGRPVLLSWFTVAPSCPCCGFRMDRGEPGYWVGSYTVNLLLTEGVLAAVLLGGLLLTWPEVPWTLLGTGCAALALLVPVAVFPHTKLLYLAIDLSFRPLEPEDLDAPREPRLSPPPVPRSP